MVSSAMSVATLADFLGQDTHSTASGLSVLRSDFNCFASAAASVKKPCTRSVCALGLALNCTPSGSGASQSWSSAGAATRCARKPGL